ncbi:hypothetical protein ACXR2U_02355 [Jatrophihabitans sp. YIM 134969]
MLTSARLRATLVASTLAAVAVTGLVEAPSSSAAAPPPGGSIVPIAPVRVLDTRASTGLLTRGTIRPLQALPGVARADVTAVLINVTVVNATAPGWIRVGEGAGTSSSNFVAGAPSATLAMVPIPTASPSGNVAFVASTGVDVVADVEGYVTSASAATTSTFTPVAPKRIADTRSDTGLVPFSANGTQLLDVRSRAGLPANATAVVANLVAIKPTATTTYLTAYPSGIARPTASTLNLSRGTTVANRVVLPLRADGRVAIYNYAGRTDVLVDVNGYLAPDGTGSYFVPSPGIRIDDTSGEGANVKLPAHGSATTTGAWVTLASASDFDGYLLAGPTLTLPAKYSDLNTIQGRAVANSGPVSLASDGYFRVASVPTSRFVVDFNGWFQKAAGA